MGFPWTTYMDGRFQDVEIRQFVDELNVNQAFSVNIALGNLPGASLINKFGRNPNVPTGSFVPVTLLGNNNWQLQAPTAVRIKAGGNAADTAAGAGAREITIQGLDTNFEEVEEAVATAGAAASSPTTTQFWRVYRMWVSGVGTYGGANVGNITVENAAGGTDLIQILANTGQTQFAAWTVPGNKQAILVSAFFNVEGTKPADIQVFALEDIDIVAAPMRSKRLFFHVDGITGDFPYLPNSSSNVVPPKTDVWVEAQGSGQNTQVSALLNLMLFDLTNP